MKKTFSNFQIIVFLLGTITWSVTMVKSGLIYKYGMGFWGPNGHDGIWHIAVINSLAKGTLSMPVYAGENLKNYHIGFDFLVAIIHKVTSISVINLYFQIIPPILAFLIGYLVYRLVFTWRRSKLQALLASFFVYFSGSFGWIVTLLRGEGIGGESLFWAQQSLSTLINPPFALSLVIIFIGLLSLIRYQNTTTAGNLLITAFLFGLLIQIKIYAGVLVILALFFSGVWSILKNRRYQIFYLSIFTLIISILLILPTYDLKTKSLIFQPFWFLESMVATTDRFYWPKMASALYNYKLSGNILKMTLAYALTFLIFIIGNLGLRIITLPWIKGKIKTIKNLDVLDIMIFSIIFLGILLPMLFIQTGNSWNSIQFFYYSLIFLSIISGVAVGGYIEKLKLGKSSHNIPIYKLKIYTITVMLIVLTIPTIISTLRHYLPSRPPTMIPATELSALMFLGKQSDGIILPVPFNKELADKWASDPPKPLYLYESTAYVSAITGKQTYLEDEVNLEITGYEWRQRKDDVTNNINNISHLRSLGITYIYIPDVKNFTHKDEMKALNIYNKDGIAIYKI